MTEKEKLRLARNVMLLLTSPYIGADTAEQLFPVLDESDPQPEDQTSRVDIDPLWFAIARHGQKAVWTDPNGETPPVVICGAWCPCVWTSGKYSAVSSLSSSDADAAVLAPYLGRLRMRRTVEVLYRHGYPVLFHFSPLYAGFTFSDPADEDIRKGPHDDVMVLKVPVLGGMKGEMRYEWRVRKWLLPLDPRAVAIAEMARSARELLHGWQPLELARRRGAVAVRESELIRVYGSDCAEKGICSVRLGRRSLSVRSVIELVEERPEEYRAACEIRRRTGFWPWDLEE